MDPRLRATPAQFSTMIEFMERHGDLSRQQLGVEGRIRSDHLWKRLTIMLNSIEGGVQRTQLKWKKVWADWKTKSKKKYIMSRQRANKTGGHPSSSTRLTELEARVVGILGVPQVLEQKQIEEQGLAIFEIQDSNNDQVSVSEISSENLNGGVQEVLQSSISPTPMSPSPPPSPIVLDAEPTPSPPPPTPPPSLPPHRAASPRSTTTRRRRLIRVCRNQARVPLNRAAREFLNLEQLRLEYEEARDQRTHRIELERLQLESQRLQVSRDHNQLLQQLCAIAQMLISHLNRQGRSRLPSTDTIE